MSLKLQLLLTLRYYAMETFQVVIENLGGIHKSTMWRIIRKVIEAVASLLSVSVKFPSTDYGKICLKRDFYQAAQFPKVVGAIDCTHIRLQSQGREHAKVFRNRKGIFFMNVQGICDSHMKCMDIVARWPGSSHDSTIFNASRIRARFLEREMGDGILLGDNGYACSNIIFTPLLQKNSPAEELYNRTHIRTRNVERAFGVWKCRFPALTFSLQMKSDFAQVVIVATAVLHNVALNEADLEPPIFF